MSFAEIMTAVAAVLSTINVVVLVLTFRRAGQWRQSEEAQAIVNRLGLCEGEVASLRGLGTTQDALAGRLTIAEGLITGMGARMENVATKADVARLTGEVGGLETLIKNTDAGVVRIEQLLMRARP